MLSHGQKGRFGAFPSLGQLTLLVPPGSCLPPPDVLLGEAGKHLGGCGSPICRPAKWLSCIRRNCFPLPLVSDQNTKSKCASISIANVQGDGVEIICSLKKNSEEILFLTSWVLQSISPLTPSCRSCAGWAFWYRSQSVHQVPGICRARSGWGFGWTQSCCRSRCAQQRGTRSPRGRWPGRLQQPPHRNLFLFTRGFVVSSLTFSFPLPKLRRDNRTQMWNQETARQAPVDQLITGPCAGGDGPW